MSMTREEIIKEYEMAVEGGELIAPFMGEDVKKAYEMLKAGLSALRPITREQVERVGRAEWEWYDEEIGSPLEGVEREWGWRCSKCKVVLPDDFDDPDNPPAMRFCPNCGAPMTDKAVDMVMNRLEVMKDGNPVKR